MYVIGIQIWDLDAEFFSLKGDEVVAVEVKPTTIEELLPPSLKQKKFGGS